MKKKKINKIHFVGIGGIGMSSLAQFLLNKNYTVSGSDVSRNSLTNKLASKGCTIFTKHDSSNIDNQDLIICSSAIDKTNPEILEGKKKKIKIITRGEALGFFTKDNKNISISGCHGKSTTTSMVHFLLNKAGLNSTLFLGAIDRKLKSNFYYGNSSLCVIEADESDNSLNYLNSFISAITNIDNDHLDFYKTKKNLNDAFKRFAISAKSKCVVNNDCKILKNLTKNITSKKIIKFGQLDTKSNDYSFKILKDVEKSRFAIFKREHLVGFFVSKLSGEYNIYNSVCSIIIALEMGVSVEQIKKSLRFYTPPSRRFETILNTKSLTIIDDYAHHPSAIKAIRKSLGGYFQNKNVILVFQPHRFSRTKILFKDFIEELSLWKNVYLVDIYSAFEKTNSILDSVHLYKEIKKSNNKIKYFSNNELLVDKILSESRKKDSLVITMGAGNIRDVGSSIKKRITNS
mgnify:CR=1 FL=1